MGGKSSSSTQSSTDASTTTNQTDERIGISGGGLVATENSSIVSYDISDQVIQAALSEGFDFAEAALTEIADTKTEELRQIADLTGDAIASSAGQREIILQADPDNTDNLRVAASAAAARGVWLQPGQSLTLATTATVYVTNASGANQVYSYMKVIS